MRQRSEPATANFPANTSFIYLFLLLFFFLLECHRTRQLIIKKITGLALFVLNHASSRLEEGAQTRMGHRRSHSICDDQSNYCYIVMNDHLFFCNTGRSKNQQPHFTTCSQPKFARTDDFENALSFTGDEILVIPVSWRAWVCVCVPVCV